MPEMWFWLVAIMLTAYVVLDGFDLGAGVLHLFIARTDSERKQVLSSIGPVWDGNEVWLIAGGATLYFAFPALFAAAFSGFYLPLMMVLWLLMFRGVGIELRSHLNHPVWAPFWDVVFAGASLLLVVFFGAALGNVVRGVPMDAAGNFFLPLWTNFTPYGETGILDWYTVSVCLFVVATITMHGAMWVRYKTAGDLNARASAAARKAFFAVVAFTVLITAVSFSVQPQIGRSFSERPWIAIFPLIALAGLAGVWKFGRDGESELRGFVASCLYIVGMLTSVVGALFPFVLPSNRIGVEGLTVYNTATHPGTMSIGIYWWLPGMILALGYSVFLYRKFAGKVEPDKPQTLSSAAH